MFVSWQVGGGQYLITFWIFCVLIHFNSLLSFLKWRSCSRQCVKYEMNWTQTLALRLFFYSSVCLPVKSWPWWQWLYLVKITREIVRKSLPLIYSVCSVLCSLAANVRKFSWRFKSFIFLRLFFGFEFSHGLGSCPHCRQLVMSGNEGKNYVYVISGFSRFGKFFLFNITKYTFS